MNDMSDTYGIGGVFEKVMCVSGFLTIPGEAVRDRGPCLPLLGGYEKRVRLLRLQL